MLLVLVVSCKPKLPSHVLSESDMESVLYDYHLAQSMAETSNNGGLSVEERRYELQQAVFRKHGITEADFDSSMVYYCSDLEKLSIIYGRLTQRMEREAEALGAATTSHDIYANLSAEGDTANVWAGRQVYALKNMFFENLQNWQQECDSTWLPGDDILWRFFPTGFIKGNSSNTFFATLVVTYTNDSVRSQTLTCTDKSFSEIRIEDYDAWTPRMISGYFFLPVDKDPQRMQTFILNKLSLIRFHKSQEWRDRKMKESVDADSLSLDSIGTDSLTVDTIQRGAFKHQTSPDGHRISPEEFRNQQSVDKKINIVKEKPYQLQKRKKNKRR